MIKKIFVIAILASLCLASSSIVLGLSQTDFKDVKKSSWYYNDVSEAKRLGILNGTGDGKFNPNKLITTAEFLTVVSIVVDDKLSTRKEGKNWYDKYLNSLRDLYIITEFDKINPSSQITRQDMMYFTVQGLRIYPDMGDRDFFSDLGIDLSKDSFINAAYREYLTEGIGEDENGKLIFGYDKTSTRAQLASMALRMKAYKEDKEKYKEEKEKIRKTVIKRVTLDSGFKIREEFSNRVHGNYVIPGLYIDHFKQNEDNEVALEISITVNDHYKFPIEPQKKEVRTILLSQYDEAYVNEIFELIDKKTTQDEEFERKWLEKDGVPTLFRGRSGDTKILIQIHKKGFDYRKSDELSNSYRIVEVWDNEEEKE